MVGQVAMADGCGGAGSAGEFGGGAELHVVVLVAEPRGGADGTEVEDPTSSPGASATSAAENSLSKREKSSSVVSALAI